LVESHNSTEILIQRVKKLTPEEIAQKILELDEDVCTEVFLGELKSVLPSPEQIGKLNIYRNATAEELTELHPSDRLMVQLIKIERLGPRLTGMLFKNTFEERTSLLEEVCNLRTA
jgi:cytokinesis protein